MDIKIKTNNYKFKVRVSGIIIVDDKVLVEQYRNSGFYTLPGGYAEVGETSLDAIKREIKEEVQIGTKDEEFLGIIENFFVNADNELTHAIDFYYRLTPIQKIETKDYEYDEIDKGYLVHHNFKWINISNISDYDLRPKYIKNNINTKELFHLIEK